MNRYAVLAVVLATLILSAAAAGGSVGASYECENAKCLVSASSSPVSILLGVALLLFALRYPQRAVAPEKTAVVGVWRRFGAFCLDFISVMMFASSFAAIPALVAEAHYTGVFQWSFARSFSRPTDGWVVMPAVMAIFVLLFLYFYLHPRSNRQTVGQYVLGYRVTAANADSKPSYGTRALLGFIGLSMWPISLILALRTSDKTFWWDTATHSKVSRVGS